MTLKEEISSLADEFYSDVVNIRQHLHQNPELSFEEYNTADYVASKLEEFGIPYQKERMAKTGITGVIGGIGNTGKVVALRADMDALPITELNDKPYKSKNKGVMHACGHDVHMSSLLGALKILSSVKDKMNGSVKFIFQPGEERIPGGASLMIKEGVLKNPEPEGIFGQHVYPLLNAGQVGFRKGMYMASADEIYIKVKGIGGHAAMPHKLVDPIVITAQIILSLQQIVSRSADPSIPTVLSFGRIIADGATNVIPDEAVIEGTFRTYDEKWRSKAHEKIEKTAKQIAEGLGGSCEIEIRKGYPVLTNEEKITSRAIAFAKEYLGNQNVHDLELWTAAEDFAYYSQEIPACFYRLGIRNEKRNITSGVHTPTFDIDEEALKTGMGLMAWLAIKELGARS